MGASQSGILARQRYTKKLKRSPEAFNVVFADTPGSPFRTFQQHLAAFQSMRANINQFTRAELHDFDRLEQTLKSLIFHLKLVVLWEDENNMLPLFVQFYEPYVKARAHEPRTLQFLQEVLTTLTEYETQVVDLYPLYLALEQLLKELRVCVDAFVQAGKSDFTDVGAAETLYMVADFQRIDRTLLASVKLGVEEQKVVELMDELLLKWKEMSDLPYFNTNDVLFLKVLQHVYDRSREANVVVSSAVSQLLFNTFRHKQYWFKEDPPCTAVVLAATHGSILVQRKSHPLKFVKSTVPLGMALTRITFVPPGVVNFTAQQLVDESAQVVTTALREDSDLLLDPLKFFVTLVSSMQQRRIPPGRGDPVPAADEASANTDTEMVDEESSLSDEYDVDFGGGQASSQRSHKWYRQTYMRPEALLYVQGEKYLDKLYTRSPDERAVGSVDFTMTLLNGDGQPDLLGDSNEIKLSSLMHMLGEQGYNHVLVMDMSCNSFSMEQRKVEMPTTQWLMYATKLVNKALSGGK